MLRISLNSTIRKTGAFTVRNLISEKNFLSCGAVNELRCSVASSILPTVSQINCTTASPANLAMGAIRWKTYNKGDLKKIRQRMGPKPGTPEYENQYEPDDRFISDIANSIDTTLTPEQQAYVEKIKKKYKALYRDVPRPDEIQGLGNFMPLIADNAEALIDYALSHIPPRAGPRRSRRKKRMARKFEAIRLQDAMIKRQKHEANLRRHQRFKRISEEIKQVKAQARALYGEEVSASSN